MKRMLAIVAMLTCTILNAGPKKETKADMTAANNIFIGWVDISLDDWKALGYENTQAWAEVIERNNQGFQNALKLALASRRLTGAQNKSDENVSGQDLHVKFSDVKFDVGSYALSTSIHFIDPKSGSEIASLPRRSYRGGHFSVNSCLEGALKKLAERVQEEIVRPGK